MIDNFEKSLKYVLQFEGGFVDNPKDPGGPTKYGITRKSYQDFLGRYVSLTMIRNLNQKDAIPFYKKKYWDVCGCDSLKSGVDFCVFDYAVNSGPFRSIKVLQKFLGLKEDGIFGDKTKFAAQNIENYSSLINSICDERIDFLKSLKTWGTFGNGWLKRVNTVRELSLEM